MAKHTLFSLLCFQEAFPKPQSKLDTLGKYFYRTWPVFFCNKQFWTLLSSLVDCKVHEGKEWLWLVTVIMPNEYNSP